MRRVTCRAKKIRTFRIPHLRTIAFPAMRAAKSQPSTGLQSPAAPCVAPCPSTTVMLIPPSNPTSIATWASRFAVAAKTVRASHCRYSERPCGRGRMTSLPGNRLDLRRASLVVTTNLCLHSRKALAREPTRESTLVAAAYQTMKMGRNETAASFWQRAIATNPWRSDYHAELGLVYFNAGNWSASAAACRDALQLRASWVEVRKRLVQCYRYLGDQNSRASEQETVRAFESPALR